MSHSSHSRSLRRTLGSPDHGSPTMSPAPRVAVIGAGMAGVLSAIKLTEAGYADVAVYEKGDRIGGAWRGETPPRPPPGGAAPPLHLLFPPPHAPAPPVLPPPQHPRQPPRGP